MSKHKPGQLPPLDKTTDHEQRHGRFRREHTQEDKDRWHAQCLALLEDSVPQDEADRIAADLYARAGKQTSRRYRHVATLPVNTQDLLALMGHIERIDQRRALDLWERFYSWAADDYRTYLAERDGNMHTLDLRTFEAFKRIEREQSEARYAALRAPVPASVCTCYSPTGRIPGGSLPADAPALGKDTCAVHGIDSFHDQTHHDQCTGCAVCEPNE